MRELGKIDGDVNENKNSIESLSGHENTFSHGETVYSYSVGVREVPDMIELAQEKVEAYHEQSVSQILETNGRYMSEADKARISDGADHIIAREHDPELGYTGGYLFSGGTSRIEVSAIDDTQMERSTKHETNHFASKHSELIVDQPEKGGCRVYQTVGLRESNWFQSYETGRVSCFETRGRGMNEGLTTMYTNRQLSELSKAKGEAAERQGIYSQATELCTMLEEIVGEDTLKKAYYGGDIGSLKAEVDTLAGENGFENLRNALDRTLSNDYTVRVEAMREAQDILAKMYERGQKR